MTLLREISDSLIQGAAAQTGELTSQALNAGHSAKEILEEALISGMATIGKAFKTHQIFLPEVLLAARAMQSGMEVLKPHLIEEGVPSIGRIVLGTVKGDLHDIGKNLVGIMLKGAGFDVVDLGNNVSPEHFISAALEKEAPVVAMSALLTTTMPVMGEVVELIKQQGLGDRIRTIVGGAPLSPEIAKQLGADAYAYDAANAVDKVKALFAELG